jgi:tRNA pseudouridine55 synthase
MVSARRVGGRRLHDLAREGIEVEREARPVTVHRFDVQPTPDPLVYRIEVQCSSGTYIRTLAADLGHLLGGGAHLRVLRRTAIGSFGEAEAAPPDAAELLSAIVLVKQNIIVAGGTGSADPPRAAPPAFAGPPPWALLAADGTLLAVYDAHPDGAAPPSSSPAPDG